MNKDSDKDFIGYEYKEIAATGERASMLLDCYTNLGWEADENSLGRTDGRKIVLRRNRKIINKVELTRLQRNMEACMDDIDNMEKSKKTKASIVALILGVVGTAFVACSVFCITAEIPAIGLCILFAVPGFILWALAPMLYPKIVAKRTKEVNQQIAEKYDEIYGICEKGNKLLL